MRLQVHIPVNFLCLEVKCFFSFSVYKVLYLLSSFEKRDGITINVPLFKKMWDIIFFLRDNNFLSRFEGHFEGAKTFLTP